MAAQAGLVLRNVRLIEDLRESRRRIVSAQDERARTLERNIHDGAQQQLVALSVKLAPRGALHGDGSAKRRDDPRRISRRQTETLEDLRDLARGIYPPLLADQGLPAALEASGEEVRRARHGRTRTVSAGTARCWSPPCTSPASRRFQNVAKYSERQLKVKRLASRTAEQGASRSRCIDDGRRFRPGSASLRLRSPGHRRSTRRA